MMTTRAQFYTEQSRYHYSLQLGCSTETQQWSPADCTNHNLAPHHTQCALDTSLPWSVPLYSACRFLDHVYLCWIFENFSSGVFPQFISWLSPGSRLWLEEESYICRWHFPFYFNCADKLPTHKPSDYKTSHCCHVVVGVEETPQCQYTL